jgi:hypothetical protein
MKQIKNCEVDLVALQAKFLRETVEGVEALLNKLRDGERSDDGTRKESSHPPPQSKVSV